MDSTKLLSDLIRAYKAAQRHKRGRDYQLRFEMNMESELVKLRDELLARTYRPGRSKCFIIHEPKMREVFAAEFRDRVVHHLFFNYTHEYFERTFIRDCYSCIKGRGTHDGIRRLEHHIRSVSRNWQRPCYVLKIDIRGYFMAIDREILLGICRRTLLKYKEAVEARGLDFDFLDYLLEIMVMNNPVEGCIITGNPRQWTSLPNDKSLFGTPEGCGLPIGNLSSQLFSNVYLNELDQYIKRYLKCRHYGRYVDDAYIAGDDARKLMALVPLINEFLGKQLHLALNFSKCRVYRADYGVGFIGAYIKPFRNYVERDTLKRIKAKLPFVRKMNLSLCRASLNSYLGVMGHFRSYRLRRRLFHTFPFDFSPSMNKLV